MNVEPGQPTRGVDVILRLDRLGMIERREIDVDLARVIGNAEGELRAAGAAEAPKRLRRRAVGNGLSGGNGEVRDRHDEPGNDGSTARLLAHPAMTETGAHHLHRAIADGAAKTAAGEIRVHASASSHTLRRSITRSRYNNDDARCCIG